MPKDLAALKETLRQVFETNLPLFLQYTHARREELLRNRLYAIVSFVFVVSVVVTLYVFSSLYTKLYNDIVFNTLAGIMMLWTTGVLVYGRRWFRSSQLLAREMNMALVPILSSCLNKSILYTHVEDHRTKTLEELRMTELMTVPDLEIVADDMYTVHKPEVFIRELVMMQKERSDSNKGDSAKTVFRGVFIKVELARPLTGVTFISTEGDRTGFGHQSFWSTVLGTGTVKETTLEANTFEADLHVATSDPVEARYILTPDFMLHLHEWWQEHKTNIRIVFRDQHMYMLLPETSIRIASSTTSTREDAIARYALTILTPMWRTLRLVEAIKV